MSKVTVSVVIPALNEAESIGRVVRAVPPDAADEIIVVDNGSTDDTAAAAEAAGARVVPEPRRGYGAACLAGSRAARGEVLVFLDGDGSFDPGETTALVAALGRGADLALGSRALGGMAPGAMPPHQRWGNSLTAALLRWLYGLRITDLGPFRAVRRAGLASLGMQEMTYGWPIEMMVKAARRDWRIVEVPVSYQTRYAGRSKVSGTVRGSVLAGYRILLTVARHAGRHAPGGKAGGR